MKLREVHELIDESYAICVLSSREVGKILFHTVKDEYKVLFYDDYDVQSISTERVEDSYGHEDRICVYLYGKEEDEI